MFGKTETIFAVTAGWDGIRLFSVFVDRERENKK